MISVRKVSKRFGSQVVLDQIDLEIEPGKTTAVVGPSGVGKSVLLKLIMGILAPEEGEIFVCGKNITRARSEAQKNEIRSILGVLFQSAALFDSLTVYENVAFPLEQRTRLSRREIHQRVIKMLCALSLESHAWNYPEEISMGMRKRVGMARSLVTEPQVLLFDEPNTGLDPVVGQEVYDLIKASRQQWGFTGVVISHELPEVFQVSDRVAMLLNGKIVQEGTPAEIMHSENAAVQQFLNGRVNGPIKIQ
ncbi:MAG: ATP-binding cassette domain-containing protein [Bdellovibrionales bacterium]|nr:ATP-binding cassette domain-containing protein [Bdellovibrionales bacterium]